MDAYERKAAVALQFLVRVSNELQGTKSPEGRKWQREVEKLQQQSSDTRTLIGIIGATGAGKSSLVNALLDEERLLPTSGMRACTAVVTEIAYNNSEHPYLAEIEFISRQQWESELKTLLDDIVDEHGNASRDCLNNDSEAGLAYAKLKAVYPNLSKEELAKDSVEGLMWFRPIPQLGKIESFAEKDCDAFHMKLLKYIDSKDKIDGHSTTASATTYVDTFEFWPLIKAVRLYTKAPVLKTGAVLVDLPGVHDSNAARAAVARNYMKQCSAFFIVARITRAVDDKSAKNLLGQSFKQQVKMDGDFGHITFVCSQSDQISIEETLRALHLEDQAQPLQTRIQELKTCSSTLEAEEESLEAAENDANDTLTESRNAFYVYQNLLRRAKMGDRVTEPTLGESPNKRKTRQPGNTPNKKIKIEAGEPSAKKSTEGAEERNRVGAQKGIGRTGPFVRCGPQRVFASGH